MIFKIITTLQVFAVLLFLFIVVKDNRIPKRIDTTSTKVERSDNKFSLYSVSRNHYTVKQFLGPLKQKKKLNALILFPFFSISSCLLNFWWCLTHPHREREERSVVTWALTDM